MSSLNVQEDGLGNVERRGLDYILVSRNVIPVPVFIVPTLVRLMW